jgi:hypothetical protein
MDTSIRAGIAGVLLCFAIGMGSSAALAAGAGTAKGVDPQADAQTGTETRILNVGADVFIGDRIITGPEGQVQIKFADETELVVGPRSSLMIEDYLLREDQSAGKFVINALNGTFRFATGVSPKDRYVIKTPTGTIGVRGTAFDLTVEGPGNGDEDGKTQLLLFHGAVLMCNLEGKCVTVDDTCEIGEYDLSDSIVLGDAQEMDDETRATLRERFQYADSQWPLLREFWVDRARDCLMETGNIGLFPSLAPPSEGSNENPPPDTGGDSCDEYPYCN